MRPRAFHPVRRLRPNATGFTGDVGPRRRAASRTAFTLIELMVVVAVLAILIGATIAASGRLIEGAKVRQTRAVMLNLEQAIDQFKSDGPLDKIRPYRQRYGGYPCDELEPFDSGIPGSGGRKINPGAFSSLKLQQAMSDYPNKPIRSMSLSIRLHSPEAAAILDQISSKHRKPPADPANEFFNRDDPNNELGPGDVTLDYFVDAWGTPFDYFAVMTPDNVPAPSDPGGNRLATSRFLVTKNRGRPLLTSYGPKGVEQCDPAFIQENGASDLIADFQGLDGTEKDVIDNPLNADNVYLDETLGDRLKQKLQNTD